jgi:hypothetical protein
MKLKYCYKPKKRPDGKSILALSLILSRLSFLPDTKKYTPKNELAKNDLKSANTLDGKGICLLNRPKLPNITMAAISLNLSIDLL